MRRRDEFKTMATLLFLALLMLIMGLIARCSPVAYFDGKPVYRRQ